MRAEELQPFSASLSWLLENPVARAHARRLLRLLDLRPGMRVLDVGCGPGRLALPVARLVGESGEVVGLDVQRRMLQRLERRAAVRRLTNLRTVHAAAGDGALESGHYDLALLVSVLGEIPPHRRQAAVDEIAEALRPGGVLAIAEGRPDPHRQSKEAVTAATEAAGLRLLRVDSVWLGFLMQVGKPQSPRGSGSA
jgi:ubiquinone/menaquinone biosynthesis C-methylase UbiE